MAKYKGIVTTDAGLELLAKACSGGSVKFTAVKTGDGAYDGTEDLSGMTALKSEKQSFGVSGITRIGTQVRVRSVLSNEGLTTGYNITEVGLFATDPDTGSEFLYAIIVAETGLEDYLPPHEDSPSSITMEIYLMLTETENDVTFTAEVVAGTYASAEAFQEFVDNVTRGTTQVGNAKTLDGHEAEYFATAEQMGMGDRLSTSILEKALTLGAGVYNFALDRGNYTGNDLPDKYYAYGMASVYRSTTTKGTTVVLWGGMYDLPIAINMHNGDAWFGWDTLFTTAGGTINGRVDVSKTDSTRAIFGMSNIMRSVENRVYEDGRYGVYDFTNSKLIIESQRDGTSTFNGTASGNLPLSGGGVVKKDRAEVMGIKNTNGTTVLQGYYDKDGLAGFLGISSKVPFYVDTNNKYYDLLHTGNKPTGTYTGNGDATKRTINIGSTMPRAIIVTSSNGMVIMTYYGAIFKETSGTTVSGLSWGECAMLDTGNIQLITTSPMLNASGVTYTYYSL